MELKLTLLCGLVGAQGSLFSVEIGANKIVHDLKRVISNEKKYPFPADELQLFLAKKCGAWLESDSEDVEKLKKGGKTALVESLIHEGKELQGENPISECLEDVDTPKANQIHILVVVPGILTTIVVHESRIPSLTDELAYYQRLGVEIQNNCQQNCGPILTKIDEIYSYKEEPFADCLQTGPFPKPFICVEGSSGMGKSQLAFALGGDGSTRPWFYWPLHCLQGQNQHVYENFSSIANAFDSVVEKDELYTPTEEVVLSCNSDFYANKELWTYGFIIELLEYCSRANVGAQMIRVEKKTFRVAKRDREAVKAVLSQMEKDGKVLPFFILDEMPPISKDVYIKKKVAFQRNVFRACGLVVIVMGTDAKISNLVSQSVRSRVDPHWWMSVVPRFPAYQSIPLSDPAKKEAWERAMELYSVVDLIAKNSRGLFSRYFVDAVSQFVLEVDETFRLADLLDYAFEDVNAKVQSAKKFMSTPDGRSAQLKALSYANAETKVTDFKILDGCVLSGRSVPSSHPAIGGGNPRESSSKMHPGTGGGSKSKRPSKKRAASGDGTDKRPTKRLNVGIAYMKLHFANLDDEDITDVDVSSRSLRYRTTTTPWRTACRFPVVEKDVLLYLAVLGGKRSAYYDSDDDKEYSTAFIFEEYRSGMGSPSHSNTNAASNDGDELENAVAHALFCASRRNGVRGTTFNDFFSDLLGEFQHETFQSVDNFDASALLLERYAGLKQKFAGMSIPFLGPPNAEWPEYLVGLNGDGNNACNFGHLFRAQNFERLDCYVMVPGDTNPLFICEYKHWEMKLDSGALKKIIEGLNCECTEPEKEGGQRKLKWKKWDLALVFCQKLTHFQQDSISGWKLPGLGIVTVDCNTGVVNWIVDPVAGEQLAIVLQIGTVLS